MVVTFRIHNFGTNCSRHFNFRRSESMILWLSLMFRIIFRSSQAWLSLSNSPITFSKQLDIFSSQIKSFSRRVCSVFIYYFLRVYQQYTIHATFQLWNILFYYSNLTYIESWFFHSKIWAHPYFSIEVIHLPKLLQFWQKYFVVLYSKNGSNSFVKSKYRLWNSNIVT